MAKSLPAALLAGPVLLPTPGEGRGKSLREDPLCGLPLQFGSERPE